jgi:amino acid transporter
VFVFRVFGVFRGFSMSAEVQTILALGLVALAAGYLLWTWFGPKKKKSGCGDGACGAVSPEVKRLQKRLRK